MVETKTRKSGGSRKRAVQAMCWECRGGTSYGGCWSPTCPLYCFLPKDKQERGEPNKWWEEDISNWEETSQAVRKKEREKE